METLREARVRRLLTYRELSERSGVPLSTLYMIESGRGNPTLRTIRRIAEALDVDPSEVVELQQAMHRRMARPARPSPEGT